MRRPRVRAKLGSVYTSRLLAAAKVGLVITSLATTAVAEVTDGDAAQSTARSTTDVKGACVQAYESSQVLRREGHLLGARQALLVCTREECPPLVRIDCADWLDDVNEALPSIVFQASADGAELSEVKVSVDGKVVQTRLDGKAIPADPGPHTLHFETAGFPAVETTVVIREGEHYRPLVVTFRSPRPERERASVRMVRPVPLLAWTFGGLSVVATASFAFWAVSGNQRKDVLQGQCAPFCSQADVETVQHRYLAADVSLGVAAASLGLASFIFFTRPEMPLRIALAPPSGPPSSFALRISGDF